MSKIDERKEANAYVIANQSFIDSVVASYSKKHGEETPEHYEVSNMINGRPVDFNDNSFFENAKAEEAQVENQRRRLANQRREAQAFKQAEQVLAVEQASAEQSFGESSFNEQSYNESSYKEPHFGAPSYGDKNIETASTHNQSAKITPVAREENQGYQQPSVSTVKNYGVEPASKITKKEPSARGQNQTSVSSIDFDELAKAREELVHSGLIDDAGFSNTEQDNSSTDNNNSGRFSDWFADFGGMSDSENQEQSSENDNISQVDGLNASSGQNFNNDGRGDGFNSAEETQNASAGENHEGVNNWFDVINNNRGAVSDDNDGLNEKTQDNAGPEYYENPPYYQTPEFNNQSENGDDSFGRDGGGNGPDTTNNDNFGEDNGLRDEHAVNNNQRNNDYDTGDESAVVEHNEPNNFVKNAKKPKKEAHIAKGASGGTTIISGADLMAEIEAIKNANQDLFANNNEIVIEEDNSGDDFDF